MSLDVDLKELFDSWPYDPDNDARIIKGKDGREILQVRQPVGIEQYELEGRPDGKRPHEKESALEYYMERLSEARAKGDEASFTLSPADCSELFQEGVLYYYRYLHLFQLKDWKRTVRDTARNLRLFDFVHRYAERDEDQMNLEKWRPYLTRMHAVARAMLMLEGNHHAEALKVIHEAIETVQTLEELDDPTFKFEQERSLAVLRDVASQIERKRPVSEIERLQKELQKAVETQEFERAAQLRDQIRELKAKQA